MALGIEPQEGRPLGTEPELGKTLGTDPQMTQPLGEEPLEGSAPPAQEVAPTMDVLPLGATVETLFAEADMPPGVEQSRELVVPLAHNLFQIFIDKSQWRRTREDLIAYRADISYDGGVTWELLVHSTDCGDLCIGLDGKPVTMIVTNALMRDVQNPDRRVVVTMSRSEQLRTRLEVFTREVKIHPADLVLIGRP